MQNLLKINIGLPDEKWLISCFNLFFIEASNLCRNRDVF